MATELTQASSLSTECELAAGGFTPDTEIITTAGAVSVSELAPGDHVYALTPATKLAKPKPVTRVTQIEHDGELVALKGKRFDLHVAPEHRILFRTKAISNPRFVRAADLDQRQYYKFLNDWQSLPGQRLDTVDITDLTDEFEACVAVEGHGHTFRAALPEGCEPCRRNSHVGYYFDSTTFKRYQSAIEAVGDDVSVHAGPNHHRRPYRFDGDDFVQFIGWFVAEGSVYWPRDRATAQVKLAQENERHRRSIADLLDSMGLKAHSDERKFEFGSQLFGHLLERLCGSKSQNKRLPEFVWSLSQCQKQSLLETLIRGDGNDQRTYYTASRGLAGDVLRLCLELGIKPRYTRRNGIWQIYVRRVNDGFQSARHVSRVANEENLYRLTIEDYCAVMAGRNGKFQWVGVSNVS